MIILKIKKNRGFVLLFAVTLAAILLSIALGVSQIALKEVKFSTSAKDTNDAFFAADTGLECALYNDKSTSTYFISGGTSPMQCLGGNVNINGSIPNWNFVLSGLGATGQGCANVTVDKTGTCAPPLLTCIISKGYNSGGNVAGSCNPLANTVERDLESDY